MWPGYWDHDVLAYCFSYCMSRCRADRKLSEAIAGPYLSKLPINTMGRGKTTCALLAEKIPLDNRSAKGMQLGFFWKKAKKWFDSNCRGQKWVAREGQDAMETAPTEKAEVVGPFKPSRWWWGTKESYVEAVLTGWKHLFVLKNCCILVVRSEVDIHLWTTDRGSLKEDTYLGISDGWGVTLT